MLSFPSLTERFGAEDLIGDHKTCFRTVRQATAVSVCTSEERDRPKQSVFKWPVEDLLRGREM